MCSAAANEPLPSYAFGYYQQLSRDCELLKCEFTAKGDAPTWAELFDLEMRTLSKRDLAGLRRYAWVLRLRMRNIAGEANYQAYLASKPPDPETALEPTLRADLENLVRRTFYWVVLVPQSEKLRGNLLLTAAGSALLFLAVIVALSLHLDDPHLFPFFLVLLAGAVGGTMSLLQRLKQLQVGDPLILRSSGGPIMILLTVTVPALTGALFAGLLFFIFAAGLIKGVIFPDFIGRDSQPHGSPASVLWQILPKDGANYCLLYAWSFIAGFVERLVPDTITRLVEREKIAAASPELKPAV